MRSSRREFIKSVAALPILSILIGGDASGKPVKTIPTKKLKSVVSKLNDHFGYRYARFVNGKRAEFPGGHVERYGKRRVLFYFSTRVDFNKASEMGMALRDETHLYVELEGLDHPVLIDETWRFNQRTHILTEKLVSEIEGKRSWWGEEFDLSVFGEDLPFKIINYPEGELARRAKIDRQLTELTFDVGELT